LSGSQVADELENEEIETGGTGKLKIILLAIGVLVLLGASVGGTIWYMKSTMVEVAAVTEGEEGDLPFDDGGLFSDGPGKVLYHRLRPTFIVTFEANSRQRYVQMEVTLVTRNSNVINALINHKPLIRNALVLLLANQDYLELQTPMGKEQLKKAAYRAVQDILKREGSEHGIERVLFTEFVMQ
jgi:flagellar FliL protein